jgi:hypothetical protein
MMSQEMLHRSDSFPKETGRMRHFSSFRTSLLLAVLGWLTALCLPLDVRGQEPGLDIEKEQLRKALKERDEQLKVLKANLQGVVATNQKLNDALEKTERERDESRAMLEKKVEEYKRVLANLFPPNNDLTNALRAATQAVKSLKAESQQLGMENATLKKVIGEYGQIIVKTRVEADIAKTEAIEAKLALETTLARNKFLLDEINKLRANEKPTPPDLPKDRKPNPPQVNIKGTIAEVGTGGDLVRLSIGSDAGLKKGHTLDVYRTTAGMQKYLGMIRVVDVGPLEAIGQRVQTGPNASRQPFQVGDHVLSDVAKAKSSP